MTRTKEQTYDRTEVMTEETRVKLVPFLRQKTKLATEPILSAYKTGKLVFNSAASELMSLDEAHSVLFVRRSDTQDFMVIVERDSVNAKGCRFTKSKGYNKIVSFGILSDAFFRHYGAPDDATIIKTTVSFDPKLGAWALTPKED